MSTSLTREGGGWRLRFQSARVERFVVDWGLQIEAALDDGRLILRIGDSSKFELRDEGNYWSLVRANLSQNGHVF